MTVEVTWSALKILWLAMVSVAVVVHEIDANLQQLLFVHNY